MYTGSEPPATEIKVTRLDYRTVRYSLRWQLTDRPYLRVYRASGKYSLQTCSAQGQYNQYSAEDNVCNFVKELLKLRLIEYVDIERFTLTLQFGELCHGEFNVPVTVKLIAEHLSWKTDLVVNDCTGEWHPALR